MLRILSLCFILLLIIVWYFRGTVGEYFGPSSQGQDQYTLLLQDALSRNTEQAGTQRVIFSQTDMGFSQNQVPVFGESEFNRKQLRLQAGFDRRNGGLGNPELPETDFSSLGSSGEIGKLPSIALRNQGISGGSSTGNSEACKGIFFDPCIVFNHPNIAGNENMYLGSTPIYRYPEEVPKSIF